MTAPIWMAAPPEVHSAMLSTGPGPGSLLAAAAEWTALSSAYASAAEELSAVLAAVQAGVWQGPTVESYVAAHVPYLAWLTQAGASGAATAAQHETVAVAYTAALAAMPTLAQLAANHATHAALMATNFFGINTIPIALNEADYARMWVQAATTMTTYHAVSNAAVAATPQTAPAPQIQKAAANSSTSTQDNGNPTQLAWWTTRAQQVANAIGQDLSGFPSNPSAAITRLETDPLLVSELPHWEGEAINTFAPQLQQLTQVVAGLGIASLETPPFAGPAGLAGLSGVAQPAPAALAAVAPAPVGGPAVAAPVAGVAPTVSVSTPAMGPPPATAPATAPAPATPPAPPPPAPTVHAFSFPYVVGPPGAGFDSRISVRAAAVTEAAQPGRAAAAAAETREQAGQRRRRGTQLIDRGYRHEYPASDLDAAPLASDSGAGALGFAGAAPVFAGTAPKPGAVQVAGPTTLTGDSLSGSPQMPMLPSSWARRVQDPPDASPDAPPD
ncbi:MAG: PPE family protein [Mycobacterium sp.]|nr:PPE family protein [Mycobacterium sp.]